MSNFQAIALVALALIECSNAQSLFDEPTTQQSSSSKSTFVIVFVSVLAIFLIGFVALRYLSSCSLRRERADKEKTDWDRTNIANLPVMPPPVVESTIQKSYFMKIDEKNGIYEEPPSYYANESRQGQLQGHAIGQPGFAGHLQGGWYGGQNNVNYV